MQYKQTQTSIAKASKTLRLDEKFAGKGWQRLAKAGKGWQRLAKAGKTLRLDEKFVGKGWQDFETG